MKMKMDEIKGKITDKSQEILTKWEEKSRDLITSFLDMFGQDGRLVSLMRSFSRTHLFPDDVVDAATSDAQTNNNNGDNIKKE